MDIPLEKKTCRAPDGVILVYSAAGAGDEGLIFVHGGLADRSFWDAQLKAFAGRFRVIAVDLPGHGESGTDRKKWGLPEFGADVRAVVEHEKLKRVVIIGNSLGGPAAIEAALLLPGQALGVIGVDTFHELHSITVEEARQRAEFFRTDYRGAVKQMVKALFHADADPAVMADAENRMARTSHDCVHDLFLSLGGYDQIASARRLSVPLWAVNGDLYPTNVESVRKIKPDFEAVIMSHMGHYPMLERPEEFNRHLADMIARLLK